MTEKELIDNLMSSFDSAAVDFGNGIKKVCLSKSALEILLGIVIREARKIDKEAD